MDLVTTLLAHTNGALLLYFLALNSFYALLLILSIPEMWTHWHLADGDWRRRLLGSDILPPISVLVPAYNEAATVVESVTSFLTLEYPRFEIVVVNDGSSDATFQALDRAFDLFPIPPAVRRQLNVPGIRGYYRSRRFAKLVVVDKTNGGKADALNAGLNAARFPYVVAMDADTVLEPDALIRLARPFLLGEDIAAVGGTIRVANACTIAHGRVQRARVDRRILPGIQTVEYLRAFLFGRLGWNRLGGNLIISGAFGLFRREYLIAVGGYLAGSVTEDIDIVVRLHRYLRERGLRDRMPFVPDPVAWTEVPTTLRGLANQRERWHRGLIGTMLQHRGMLFNPRYGSIGLVATPFYVFGEMLAPVIELLGYVMLGVGLVTHAVDGRFALLFLAVAIGYGLLLSVWAVVLEEMTFRRYPERSDFLRLLLCAFLEPFGFRQLTVVFRLHGFWRHARGDQTWSAVPREGFNATASLGDIGGLRVTAK
jgi:cellulose synthase/poly-beta-1,6-N-acetylglucosamine synthase-like glycosyltransferase